MRYRSFILCWALLVLAAQPAGACLWTYEADLRGRIHMVNKSAPGNYVEGLLESTKSSYWEAQVERLQNAAPENYEDRNDLAVALIRTGRTEQALPILLEIEQAHPGLYETASNLGTAYELTGDVEKARSWIQKGLERNPSSHYDSEWIHLQILETKLRLKEQPDWLDLNRILPEVGDSPGALGKRASDLEYQLHERLSLVEPPDPIVAALLFELGDLQGRLGSAKRAAAVYQLALTYKPANEEVVRQRLAEAQAAADSREWLVSLLNKFGHPMNLVVLGGGFVLLCLIGVLLWRRYRVRIK